jgi:hypothetical protein
MKSEISTHSPLKSPLKEPAAQVEDMNQTVEQPSSFHHYNELPKITEEDTRS